MNLHFVGGRFDGANGPKPPEVDDADEIWAAPDPAHLAPNGMLLWPTFRDGWERYCYFKTLKGVDYYVNDCVPEDLIFTTTREFYAPALSPAQMWEQMRREVPDELWDEWFIR